VQIRFEINSFVESSSEANDLRKIEAIGNPNPVQLPVEMIGKDEEEYFEIALNMWTLYPGKDAIKFAFLEFAEECNVKCQPYLAFDCGNLWFVPVFGTRSSVEMVAQFSFVRVLRYMPKLRGLPEIVRTYDIGQDIILPDPPPLVSDLKVAILDGGLPPTHPIRHWVADYHKADETAEDSIGGTDHGLAVSSAFLFGPLKPNMIAENPYTAITHIRVLDAGIEAENPLELYQTLGKIDEVLRSKQFEFINLSIGPNLSICDQDVHVWTSVIDRHLSDGSALMTIAVGNNGTNDRISENARVQVPADCVNALAVGSADNDADSWRRAEYSAVGPGRLPGLVKPDLLAFGGGPNRYFHVLVEGESPRASPNQGTSLAAPNTLRIAVAIRALLGNSLSLLGIKALLIHCADRKGYDIKEVGWGKIPNEVQRLIIHSERVTTIVYQGELEPAKYVRAMIPYPSEPFEGKVTIKATMCYATQVDPENSDAYTRSGLEISFRPNRHKFKNAESEHPESATFFTVNRYLFEEDLRVHVGKWEPVLKAEKTFYARTLKEPCFDIHYTARENSAPSSTRDSIPYVMIISLETPKENDFRKKILRKYPQLVPIQPRIPVPDIRV